MRKRIGMSLLGVLMSSMCWGQSLEKTLHTADSLFWIGDYAGSQRAYETASMMANTHNDKTQYYFCLQKEAECLVREGFFDQARSKVEDALSTCPTEDVKSRARLLNVLGLSEIGTGKYTEAENTLNKAIETCLNKSQYQDILSDSYNHLSILFWSTGHNEKALNYALSALTSRQKIYAENSAILAGSYLNLGLIYQLDKPEEAINYYNKAIAIYRVAFHGNHPLIASTLINKGLVYKNEKTYNSALEEFEKASQMIVSSVGNNHINYAFVLSHIGKVYLAKENVEEAERYEREALKIYISNFGHKHPEVAECYNELASIKLNQKKHQEALDLLQKALIANSFAFCNTAIYSNPSSSDYIHADLMLSTLLLKAEALEEKHINKDLKIKDLTYALKTLEYADTLSENIRHHRTNKKDKVELGKITNDIYEHAVHLCLMLSEITLKKKYYDAQAFSFSEKNKAAVLLEAISEANAKSFAGLPDEALKAESALKIKIAYNELMVSKSENEEDKSKWRSELLIENRNYERFVKKLEQEYPAYYQLKYAKSTLTLKDVQQAIPDQTMMLHYFISDKYSEVIIFMIDNKKINVLRKSKIESLDKDLIGFRNAIRYKIEDKYIELGNDLSKQLLPNPHKAKHIVIIPDGRLSATPFEVLFTKKATAQEELPFALRKAAFSYNYSASLYLKSIKDSKVMCEKGNVLLCAPVSFQGKMDDLPGSELEVKKLDGYFSEHAFKVTTQVGSMATEGDLKKKTSDAWSYIHFATHGLVNENDPDLSKIMLHPSQGEDGDLFSGEIYNLNLNTELITLSACQTGLGKVTKGEGLIGLSRALLYAGANNIIVSLWNVSDEATLKLMDELYSNILKNKQCINYAEALQQAKLLLLKDNKLAAPYYWAPFILIGH
jgi:CHAT domain-containing protein